MIVVILKSNMNKQGFNQILRIKTYIKNVELDVGKQRSRHTHQLNVIFQALRRLGRTRPVNFYQPIKINFRSIRVHNADEFKN